MSNSAQASATVLLKYRAGTLELSGLSSEHEIHSEFDQGVKWDARSRCWRSPAHLYAPIVKWLVRGAIPFKDEAATYERLNLSLDAQGREPRPYQNEAVQAWLKQGARGVVVLPTGSGKSLVALLAIGDRQRSTLVIAPTLDLVRQWYDLLRNGFGVEVGVLGGGEFDIKPLTVATYDSAHLHVEHWGSRFGLVVYDEVHHLPSPSFQMAAKCALAPYRLGLTATPERSDGAESVVDELVGPLAYRRDIVEMAGEFLAAYETVRVEVQLSPREREQYELARGIYLAFARQQGVRMGSPQGFTQFIQRAARSKEGRRALDAYRLQKNLAIAARGKLEVLSDLLTRHGTDRCLIFTFDNNTVYQISRLFLIPAITHQTKVKERSEILALFAQGSYSAVVTSRVLNEGVDVPAANVAIVVSGTGSVREHVQRLGRILRPQNGKLAQLYELVTSQTGETKTSERRREHQAYR